jgi:hypothetical protein
MLSILLILVSDNLKRASVIQSLKINLAVSLPALKRKL